MHQSISRNRENSSSMWKSHPKYLFSIEIEISAIVIWGIYARFVKKMADSSQLIFSLILIR